MASKHRVTVGEELRYDSDLQGLRNLAGTYAKVLPLAGAGIDPTGVADSTAAVAALLSAAPPGALVQVPADAVIRLASTLTLSKSVTIDGPGELRWAAGIANAAAIKVASSNVTIRYVRMTNPSLLSSQTGGKNIGIEIAAHEARIESVTIDSFQNGIVVDPDGEWENIYIVNNRIKDILGAGDGPGSASSYGEDRGDGITCWGAQAVITGNIVNCKAGSDARIGIHMEGLATYETVTNVGHPDALVTIGGNVVSGKFRRGIAVENGSNVAIQGNTVSDATWWGIAVSGDDNASSGASYGVSVTGNTILHTRTSSDNQGSSWTPQRSGIMVYGGVIGALVVGNNIRIQGTADSGIQAQGVNASRLPVDCIIGSNIVRCEAGGTVTTSIFSNNMTTRLKIDGNIISGFSSAGIYAYGASLVEIHGNSVDGVAAVGGMRGIRRDDISTSRALVHGNTIRNVSTGIHWVNQQNFSVLSNQVEAASVGIDCFGSSNASLGQNSFVSCGTNYNNVSGSGISVDNGVALSAGFARRRKYDVRDYMGSDDIGAAVNRAIAAASADAYTYGKPGQVVLHPFNLPITTEIALAHGVDIIGSGWGKTVFRPQGGSAVIHHISSSGSNAIRDLTIANFEIDGSEQTGTYATSIKGLYIQRLRRVLVDHLYVHDTGATGIGNDFHDSCVIRDCLVTGCGRLNDGTGAGGAGIGIGTGVWITEDLLIEGCRTHDNKRAGLFFETQSGVLVSGVRVLGHAALRNGEHGIGDAGCTGLIVADGISRKNTKSGFATYQGTVATGTPGIKGIVRSMDIAENGENGAVFDWSGRTPFASFSGFETTGSSLTVTPKDFGYTLDGCNVRENGQHGVLINAGATTAVPNHRISDCDASYNTQAGICVTSTGATADDLTIVGNRAVGNGQGGTTSRRRSGISITASTNRLRIERNRCNDTQGSKTQTYGLLMATGTMHTDAWIDSNDFRFNAAANTDLSGTIPTTATVNNNPSFPGTPGALIADTFNRADATSLGSPDGGRNSPVAWAILDAGTGGGWGITSKGARPNTGGTGNVTAYQDNGTTGGITQAVLQQINSSPSGGLAFRILDAANVFYIALRPSGGGSNLYAIQKRVAGSNTAVTTSTVVPTAGDTLRVEDNGATINLYVNGALAATASDTAFNASTKVGLHGNATVDTFTRYQNFSYRAVA